MKQNMTKKEGFKKIIEVLNSWNCVESYTVHKKQNKYQIEIFLTNGGSTTWII